MPATEPTARRHRLQQAQIAPLDENGITAALVGLAAFIAATVGLWLHRSALVAQGREWWLWVGLAGVGLGLLLLAYFVVRRQLWARPRGQATTTP